MRYPDDGQANVVKGNSTDTKEHRQKILKLEAWSETLFGSHENEILVWRGKTLGFVSMFCASR